MAKKPKKEPTHIDVAARLPIPVLHFCLDIAKMTGLTASDVIGVMLAIEVKRSGVGKTGEHHG